MQFKMCSVNLIDLETCLNKCCVFILNVEFMDSYSPAHSNSSTRGLLPEQQGASDLGSHENFFNACTMNNYTFSMLSETLYLFQYRAVDVGIIYS